MRLTKTHKMLTPKCALFFLLLALQLVFAVHAQESGDTQKTTESSNVIVPESIKTPRATMDTFLTAMNDVKNGNADEIITALSTMDLSDINSIVRKERGTDLAWSLLEIIDRTRFVKIDQIPNHSTGNPWVFSYYDKLSIQISRQDDGSWLFDRKTIKTIPNILLLVENQKRVVAGSTDRLPLHIRIREQLPSSLKRTDFLIENWRWVALLIVIATGVFADWIVSTLLRNLIRAWLRKRKQDYAEVPDDMLRPLGVMVLASIWWIGISLIGLPEMALLIMLVAVKFLASAAGVWATYRLVDLLAAWLHAKAEATANKLDDVLFPLIPKTLKIFVTVIGIVFIADNLNIDITGVLAGLGLGGLAFALAAKDMVQNLFGSVTVLLDRTFAVGDWIKVNSMEGTVEHMGFRSTRLRTFYNSLLTVPNSVFITAEVDNMGERRFRRYSTKFGVEYSTPPENIEAFCEGIRELVRQHPYMRKDYYHVYLNDLGASSLDVMVYVFWETPDWSTELRERHRFLLDCLRLAKSLNVEFAFPTQTLHMHQESGNGDSTQTFDSEQAREIAQGIVDHNTGLGVKPPPVQIS